MGVIGFIIIKKHRPEFYKNRSTVWKITVAIVYTLLGPAIFLFSMIILMADNTFLKTKNHESTRSD